jgi:hypothetical protein
MTHTPWTRLEGSHLWEEAAGVFEKDTWRRYHAFGHPLSMYKHARDTFGFAYCAALDAGILTHDVIIDHDAPEWASWEWLRVRQVKPDLQARDLILSTEHHRPGADNRLLMLDLSSFMFDEQRRANTEELREEQELKYRWDRETFVLKSTGYLTGLEERIGSGIDGPDVPAADRAALREIHAGIGKTIAEMNAAPSITLM